MASRAVRYRLSRIRGSFKTLMVQCRGTGRNNFLSLHTEHLRRRDNEHSSTCHCVRILHNLLNVLEQIANKMGFKKINVHEAVA
jgi:hypothetical protein